MKIDGAILRAALECASKPTKRDPHYWTTGVRVGPFEDGAKTVVEATDGQMCFRLVLEQECSFEGFLRRELVSRMKDDDEVEIEDGLLEIEECSIHHDMQPLDVLTKLNGEKMRVWPDFGEMIPMGKRTPARKLQISNKVIEKLVKSAKHLGSDAYLMWQAGGVVSPVKVTALTTYGHALWLLMPMGTEDAAPESQSPSDG